MHLNKNGLFLFLDMTQLSHLDKLLKIFFVEMFVSNSTAGFVEGALCLTTSRSLTISYYFALVQFLCNLGIRFLQVSGVFCGADTFPVP